MEENNGLGTQHFCYNIYNIYIKIKKKTLKGYICTTQGQYYKLYVETRNKCNLKPNYYSSKNISYESS